MEMVPSENEYIMENMTSSKEHPEALNIRIVKPIMMEKATKRYQNDFSL